MVFYEDLVKKVQGSDIELSKEKYKYGLNIRYKLSKLGTGVPLTLIGLYYSFELITKGATLYSLIGVLIFMSGIVLVRAPFKYKMEIDLNEKKIRNQNSEFEIEMIKSAELKKMAAPGTKRLEACVSIITEDKKNYIIPLIMHNKVEFASVIKKLLGAKFTVVKE